MSELNALFLDEGTGTITIAAGATGWFIFLLDTTAALNTDTDRAILGVGSRNGSARPYSYTRVFRKDFPLLRDSAGQLYVRVALSNADTRSLSPGKYYWDLTVATDPARDAAGNAVVDETTDHVYPIYAGTGTLPTLTIDGGVPIV